jgi:hypothetical protein
LPGFRSHQVSPEEYVFIGVLELSWILDANTLQVNSSLDITIGARHLASLGYMYGLFMSAGVYILLSRIFAARQTIVKTDHETV